MEETENKYEDDAEKKDDDEAAEVERGPVARAEDAQPQHTLAPAGPAQAGGRGSHSHPLVLGPAIMPVQILLELCIIGIFREIKHEKFY